MPSKTRVVAITGGIGSGKSVVAKLFESWGAKVVDADILAREVVQPGSEGLAKIVENFSEPLTLADGSLNRPMLASIIFSNPEKKKLLESILHPLIRKRWLDKLSELRRSGVPVIAYVIPLFFESRTAMPELEKVILVSAPEDLRVRRIMGRDGFTEEMARLRLSAQLPDSQKFERSDFVLVNDSSLEELERKTKEVWHALSA
jgi:dephospho-CoA kinase